MTEIPFPKPRYDRSQLFGGHVISGPAVVVQHNSTILIPPDYTANVGQFGKTRPSKAGSPIEKMNL
ncbi:MAG: hypothetical protein CM1200mP41_22710 [Gammaproteobacteria bacterium]|nr:MAG: hypothetical protein CM1200mP41_22710 [Gammaproteobacteria bacterium]